MIFKSHFRISELILRQPGIRLGEIVAQARVSVQTAMRVLSELLALRAVREETLKGGKRIIVRRFYPYLESEEGRILFSAAELEKRKAFLAKNPRLRGPLGELVRELPQIASIVVFGSFARDSQTRESDLDLLFLVKKKPKKEHVRNVVERCFITFNHEVSLKMMTFKEFRESPLSESILRDHVLVRGIDFFLDALSQKA